MRGAMHYMLEDAGNSQEMAIEHLTVGLPLNTYLEYRDRLRSIVVARHEVVSPDPSVGARYVTVVDASVRIPLMADSDSIPIADSVPDDGGHAARVS